MIIGLDEVGRGSWAGPLVVGVCSLSEDCLIDGLTDSKKLTSKRREVLDRQIREVALGVGLGWVEAPELDRIGVTEALKLAARRALADFEKDYASRHAGVRADAEIERIVIDGTIALLDDPRAMTLVKADALVLSVSAASIVAKVARDHFMIELSRQVNYQQYGFAKNVGYGTKAHHQAILDYGVTDQHRLSFRPMSEIVGFSRDEVKNQMAQTSKMIGNWGEDEAARWLESHDFTILARNWRTKQFEIDIVAQKDEQIYLIEVKTRKNNDFGGGAAAINQFKRQKLQLAAETVLVKYPQSTVIIAAMFVTGESDNFAVSELIEID